MYIINSDYRIFKAYYPVVMDLLCLFFEKIEKSEKNTILIRREIINKPF